MSMVEDRYRTDYSPDPRRDDAGAQPAVDPLTELARLIGQADPYADLKARRAAARLQPTQNDQATAPGWLSRPAPSAYDDRTDEPARRYTDAQAYRTPAAHEHDADAQHDQYAAYEGDDAQQPAHDTDAHEQQHDATQHYQAAQYADERYADDRQHDGRQTHDDYDDRYHITAPTADDYDGHLPPRGDDDGARGQSRRGGLVTVAAVIGMALIGTAGAFAYRAFTGPSADSPPPTIKADPTPMKGPPATPAADAQDKAFQDRVGGANAAQVEKVVPREEQPVAQPAPAWPAPPKAGSGVAAATPTPAPAAPPPAAEPKRVKTLTIRPDATGEVTQTTPQAKAPTAPAKVAKADQPAAPVAGGYVVQLSAQRSEADARSSYSSLQAKYPNVLGSRQANIRRADTDDGVYYRVQIGPFATSQAANAFCSELKSAGGQCIVPKKE